jgi:transcriptional regulator with XRE-family HTH domain
MPSVAEQLRQAREEQKLSVHQVAEATKIRTDHVRALESGQHDVFAAPVHSWLRARLCRAGAPGRSRLMAELDGELSQSESFEN